MDADETGATIPRKSWRWSAPSIVFLALTAINIVILILAANRHTSSSDAAGNAMSNAFMAIFVLFGAGGVGLITLLFCLIRNRAVGLALIALQGGATVLLVGLLR